MGITRVEIGISVRRIKVNNFCKIGNSFFVVTRVSMDSSSVVVAVNIGRIEFNSFCKVVNSCFVVTFDKMLICRNGEFAGFSFTIR